MVVYFLRRELQKAKGSFEISRLFQVRDLGSRRIWSWDVGLADRCC